MTRTEFIEELRKIADDVENGNFHITDIGKSTLFCNKNYGEIWTHVTDECSIHVSLYHATKEEKGILDHI